MSDPSPSGETWVCTAANALTSPCTERRPHDFGGSTCGPVPGSEADPLAGRDLIPADAILFDDGEVWVQHQQNAVRLGCQIGPDEGHVSHLLGTAEAIRLATALVPPVSGSDTPSDERACERPGCGHPMDDHDGEHGCEDCVMCPAYVPPIGSRLHGQWAGSNEDPVRWCALCGTWEDEADWITHSGHASLFPTDDVRHADAVTAEPEWSTRPVPSSDTPSDERAVVCAICDDPVAWSCTGDLIHRDRVLRDHDPVLDEATVRWLHGDPDAPAAPSAPVDGPERCHVGIDDGRLVQRLRAETISRAEHLVGPWTVDLIALAADRIEALAGGGGWSPKFETFEQYHAWVAASPTPVDGDSGRRGKAQIMATALHDAGVNTTVSASDNGLLIRVHDRHTPRLLELLALSPVGEERRPVDGGKRSQSEQWFVVHHNQIRSLRFGTFPIERLARASIAACTCGPHTLRHTVTTTYTASTTEEFVAAAADRGEG